MIQYLLSLLKGSILIVLFLALFAFLMRPLVNLTLALGIVDYISVEIMAYVVLLLDIGLCYLIFLLVKRFFKRLQET